MYNRIFLIGYMGCGKTTIGRLFSEKINAKFIDMDQIIEKAEQMPIRKIFMLYGEHSFRNKEAELLDKLCNVKSAADFMTGGKGAIDKMMKRAEKFKAYENLNGDYVVSCGGGIILDDLNRRILQKECVIFLKGDPNILFERIKEDTNRPNAFMGVYDENKRLAQFLERYAQRLPLYEQCCRFTVDIDGKTPEEIASQLFYLLPSSSRC